jgi:hypothetical protein
MLKLVLCSSRDGVPLKLKKKTWRQYSPSIQIGLSLVLTPVKSRWTILVNGCLKFASMKMLTNYANFTLKPLELFSLNPIGWKIPQAASDVMNGFPKAAETDICRRFLFIVCSDFQTPVQVATGVFQTSFHDGVGCPRENGQE